MPHFHSLSPYFQQLTYLTLIFTYLQHLLLSQLLELHIVLQVLQIQKRFLLLVLLLLLLLTLGKKTLLTAVLTIGGRKIQMLIILIQIIRIVIIVRIFHAFFLTLLLFLSLIPFKTLLFLQN